MVCNHLLMMKRLFLKRSRSNLIGWYSTRVLDIIAISWILTAHARDNQHVVKGGRNEHPPPRRGTPDAVNLSNDTNLSNDSLLNITFLISKIITFLYCKINLFWIDDFLMIVWFFHRNWWLVDGNWWTNMKKGITISTWFNNC